MWLIGMPLPTFLRRLKADTHLFNTKARFPTIGLFFSILYMTSPPDTISALIQQKMLCIMPVKHPFPPNCYPLISVGERHQATTYSNEGRRATFLSGRLAMRTLLMSHLNLLPNEVPLITEASGAPALENQPDLHVSVTHTLHETAAVFAHTPVGIDLETIRKRRDDLWKFLLAPSDYEAFHALALPPTEKNILLWVVKEAVLKGLKTGFRLSPKKINACIDLQNQVAAVTDHEERTWKVPFTQHGDAWLAVALLQSKKTGG